MKVAWVCEYPASTFADRPNLSGAPASHPVPWIVAQAPLVARSGVELHIITVSKHIAADDEFERDGIHFHFLKISALPRAILFYQGDRRRITACLERVGPDLVHGFGTESSFGYSAVSSRFPSVLMIQGIVAKIVGARGWATLLRQPGLLISLGCEWLTMRRAGVVICETAFAADFVRGYRAAADIRLIRTPIRDRWFDVVRAPTPNQPEVLFLGWAVPAKGIDVMIEAFGRMVVAVPEAMLHVVGAYDAAYYRDVLAPMVARLGLTDRVTFHGGQPPDVVAARLARATVLVLPTRMDTAPNVLAEARAAGVPVIATAVGGVPELIQDAVDGVLVAPGSVEGVAAATVALLRDPDRAASLAARGRLRAERDHRLSTQVPLLLDVYRDVCADARRSA